MEEVKQVWKNKKINNKKPPTKLKQKRARLKVAGRCQGCVNRSQESIARTRLLHPPVVPSASAEPLGAEPGTFSPREKHTPRNPRRIDGNSRLRHWEGARARFCCQIFQSRSKLPWIKSTIPSGTFRGSSEAASPYSTHHPTPQGLVFGVCGCA